MGSFALAGGDLEQFASVTTELLCVIAPGGCFTSLNAAWTRVLGWSLDELCSVPCTEFVHPQDRERTTQELRGIVERGVTSQTFRCRMVAKDGTYRWLLWKADPTPRGGHIYAAAHDVTDQVRVDRQKEELTALLVHDLKNPLSAMRVNAEFLLKAAPSEDVAECARDLQSSADQMMRMILNLLDISRSEDGVLVPRIARIDVAEAFEAVRRSVGMQAALNGKTLDIRLPEPPLAVHADVELLRRVLENLADNSLRHARHVVRLEALEQPDGVVELRVSDDGRGIPEEARATIFDKYAQLPSAQRTKFNRGLGLVFCKLAVEAHGGRIFVDGNVPEGSVFHVVLPRR